jgi:hypothetical protein
MKNRQPLSAYSLLLITKIFEKPYCLEDVTVLVRAFNETHSPSISLEVVEIKQLAV